MEEKQGGALEKEKEYELKINKSFSIPEELDVTKAVMVGVECHIYETAERDLHNDNKYRIIYKSDAVGFPIVSQSQKKYLAQVKSSKSKAFRWKVMEYGEDYESFMDLMLEFSDDVIEFVRSLRCRK
jgi:hypothetical protein